MTFDGFISYSHAADGRLAPAVQRGLHRLAKPWHRRRALWIFRDQTGLSVTPALWSSIQQALDGSEWFVLLASPEAAQSPWVNREIEHWIETKPAGRILPVVTDGEWRWDAERGDLAADSTAVPEALRGVFAEEPLFLDLRWARDDRHLSLQHARFREAMAQLAAPMHGVSKDELEGEDLRHHRRARRLRSVAAAALAVLTVLASLAGVLARHNADRATASAVEARRQQQVALQQRGNAERSAQQAQRQGENARTQEARARAASVETERQERRAREQRGLAERAAAEAGRQLENARRQQQLAKRAQQLAEEQKAVAREQSELAQQSATETARQRIIAEKQQRLASEAAAETDRQRKIAQHQQRMAQEAAAEARRQEAIARANARQAQEAAEEARRQEANAAEQKHIALSRRLLNQAKATVSNDPATALKLGIAAQRIQPGPETRSELTGLVTATRRLGTISAAQDAGYGRNDILAVVESDFSASIWSVADRAEPVRLATLDGRSFVGKPVFSPDGRTLAISGGRDFEPLLFDVSDPARPALLATVPAPFAGWLSFSPDGQTLAAVTIEGEWTLWDMTDRANPALLTRQTIGYETSLAFSPDSRTVVTAGTPGTVWDITDRRHPTRIGTLDGSWRRVVFSPTKPLLAANDQDGTLAVWHMDDRAKPRKFFAEPSRTYTAAFDRTGLILATSDSAGTARLWDLTANAPVPMTHLTDHGGSANSLAFSPDSGTLATTGASGALSLWAVEAHGEPKVLGRAHGENEQGLAAALTSDGKRLTTAHFDGTATVWDLTQPAGFVEHATVRVHPMNLEAAAVSPSGDTIAALGSAEGGSVTLTDLSDPGSPVSLGALPAGPYDRKLAFGPDGRTLAVSHDGSDVLLWDLTDRHQPERLADLPGNDLVSAIAFSPDGRTVAVATNRTVNLWNLADRSRPVRTGTLKGHSDVVLAMAFSPDGRTLATGSRDKTAALWNVADGTRLRRQAILTGSSAPVWSVAFAPDGRTVATGTNDDAAALWDVAELSRPVRIATLRRADLKSLSLLFHPDGRTLTSSGINVDSTRAVLWDYSTLNDLRADPAALACPVAGGGFTPQEWAAAVPEAPYQPTCPG